MVSFALFRKVIFVLGFLVKVNDSQTTTKVTIVHTSDVHLHFTESGSSRGPCHHDSKCHGSLSRFVKFIEELKGQRSNLLVVDTGGFVRGKLLQSTEGKEAVADLIKPLPYDAMTFGELELSDGIDALAEYVKIVGPKFLCTNIKFTDFSESGRYLSKVCHKTMIKMYGELQIGIISYIHQDAMTKSVPGITIRDEVEALEEGISELEATSADISIILVLGYSQNPLDITILRDVPKINLIVSGGSHMMFYNGTPPSGAVKDYDYPHLIRHPEGINGSRPVPMQMIAGGYFHLIYAGRLQLKNTHLDVWVDPAATSNPVYMDGEKDAETERLVAKYQPVLKEVLGKAVGFSTFLLDGSTACRRRECAMGNLMADGMVEAALLSDEKVPPGAWTVAAVALLDSVRITSSLERGDIYLMDLQDAVRNDTELNLLQVSGSELRLLLESALNRRQNASGDFLQVSGLQVTDQALGGDEEPQLDISAVCTNCTVPRFLPLEEEANYTVVVTSAFLARVTAPGGELGEAAANRSRHLRATLFESTSFYINHTSPVLVRTGERLMMQMESAALRPHAVRTSIVWLLAASALLVRVAPALTL